MFLNLKHGKFFIFPQKNNIYFKILKMDESFRIIDSEIREFYSETDNVKIRSTYQPDLYFINDDEIFDYLWGSNQNKDMKESILSLTNDKYVPEITKRIIAALKEWDGWMDTQNPIPIIQKQKENILNYHSRMVTIKTKEEKL